MEEITIVVIAYNRKKSLERLLQSLDKVNYLGDKVRLYISIDKDEKNHDKNQDVINLANQFKWNFGEKIINCERK